MQPEPHNITKSHDTAGLILVLLFVIDGILLAIFLSHRLLGEPTSDLFNIGRDHGFPEFFQYIKEIWFSLVLFAVYLRRRELTVLIWSVMGGILLLDDAIQLHERAGNAISNALSFAGTQGIRGQDFGEVIAAAGIGLIFVVVLAVRYRLDNRELQAFSRNLFILLCGLAVLGVILDVFVHGAQSLVLFIIEDFGEMIMISMMLWYSLRYFESQETELIGSVDRYFAENE